jgi:hypothetical protein
MIVKILNGDILDIKDQNINNICQLKIILSKILKRRENDIDILTNGNILSDNYNFNKSYTHYDVVLNDSFHGSKVSYITI